MSRLSMPFVLLTLAACAPVAPGASTRSDASAADTSAADASASDPAAVDASAPDSAAVGGEPGAVEGSPGSGEIQTVPDEQIRVGPGLGDETCNAEPAQGLIGRNANEAVVKQAMTASGAKSVRVIPHDGMVTMDYRGDRLNIQLDERGNIVAITCG